MSGEVYAAAKASMCCDAVGEEHPKGRRGNNTPLSGDAPSISRLSTTSRSSGA